jgi:hypothetical protein
MSDEKKNHFHRDVVIDFIKYSILIAASFITATRIYYVSFIGTLLFVDMFTRRFAVKVKLLHAAIVFVTALIFVNVT